MAVQRSELWLSAFKYLWRLLCCGRSACVCLYQTRNNSQSNGNTTPLWHPESDSTTDYKSKCIFRPFYTVYMYRILQIAAPTHLLLHCEHILITITTHKKPKSSFWGQHADRKTSSRKSRSVLCCCNCSIITPACLKAKIRHVIRIRDQKGC